MRLPSIYNCPECGGSYGDCESSKRQCHDDRDHRPINKSKPEQGHVFVHDRLGKRVSFQDQLEDKANDRVRYEEPFNFEIEHQHNYRYDLDKYP